MLRVRVLIDQNIVYKSPQVDMGYDISDYKDIDPKYGTLADVDELIAKLGQHGMKLMMDLVVNHTSDQVIIEIAHNMSSLVSRITLIYR
jgi:glycosidase